MVESVRNVTLVEAEADVTLVEAVMSMLGVKIGRDVTAVGDVTLVEAVTAVRGLFLTGWINKVVLTYKGTESFL